MKSFYANALGPEHRTAQLAGMFHYPVKSCAGLALDAATLNSWGLDWDREWMIVDARGGFVSQRHNPKLALIKAKLTSNALILSHSNLDDIAVPFERATQVALNVTVWRDMLDAIDAGDAVADWITAAIGKPARLVRFPESGRRNSDETWTGSDAYPVHFGDGWALHVVFASTHAHLQSEIGEPLDLRRFRPNLVFDGLPAFSEDHVYGIRNGGHILRFCKPCYRCITTTTDQDRGERASDAGLNWLKRHRMDKVSGGPTFGQNVVVVKTGPEPLRVGSLWDIVQGDSGTPPAANKEARHG